MGFEGGHVVGRGYEFGEDTGLGLFGVSWEMVGIQNNLGILGGCIPPHSAGAMGSRTSQGWLWPGLCSPLHRDKHCRVPPPGVPMGVLSCMKYLMFIFNVLVFVSPPGPRGVQGWREPVPGEQHLQLAQGWVTPAPGRGPRVQASPVHMG